MTDEMYEAQARNWLDGVDVPPPRLEVAQIVQIGRAQVRRRRALAVGGTAAVVLGAVAAFPAALRIWPDPTGEHPAAGPAMLDCTVTGLQVPDGAGQGIGVTAVDPTGRYFVGAGTDAAAIDPVTGEPIVEPAVAILWRDGEPAYIQRPRGTIHAADVNSHGIVVGSGQVIEDPFDLYGWVYSDGQSMQLPAPPGYAVSNVAGVNDAGDIAGNVTDFNGDGQAVVWRAVGADEVPGQPEILPAPEGEAAHAADIAEDGTVVGSLASEGDDLIAPTRAYLWDPDGVGRELPSPPGTTDASAHAVSGEWVIGTAYVPVPEGSVEPPPAAVPSLGPDAPYEGGPPARVQLPVRWNLRTGSVELIDPGVRPWRQFDIMPQATSNSGDVLISDLSIPLLLRGDEWFTVPFEGLAARPSAMSADGTTLAGELTSVPRTSSDEPRRVPVVWHC